MKRILFIVGLVVSLASCEKQELNAIDTIQAIGYEVKGWSTSKTSKTSKNDDNTKFDKTTTFEIENSFLANDMGLTPNGHKLYEILLTNGEEPNTNEYEVIGSVVYHIDQENFLIVSTNDKDHSFHGRYSTYVIDGVEYNSNF